MQKHKRSRGKNRSLRVARKSTQAVRDSAITNRPLFLTLAASLERAR